MKTCSQRNLCTDQSGIRTALATAFVGRYLKRNFRVKHKFRVTGLVLQTAYILNSTRYVHKPPAWFKLPYTVCGLWVEICLTRKTSHTSCAQRSQNKAFSPELMQGRVLSAKSDPVDNSAGVLADPQGKLTISSPPTDICLLFTKKIPHSTHF